MKNLFFWKGVEKANFIRVEDGWMFSPHGSIGKSYLVNEERMNLLSRHLRRYNGAATISIIVLVPALILTEYRWWGFLVIALACAGMGACYKLTIRSALQGIEPAAQGPTRQARRDQMISTMSHGRINFMIGVGIVFLPLGVWVLWNTINEGSAIDLLLSLVFAGMAVAFIAFGMRYRRVKRRLDGEGQS